MSTHKVFITAEQLMQDSVALAHQILESDFRPDYIVGVWRGGTPVGIAVQEHSDIELSRNRTAAFSRSSARLVVSHQTNQFRRLIVDCR